MRVAVVEDGLVTNVIVANDDNPAIGWYECPDEVGIGWSYDDGTFAPPPPVPAPPGQSATDAQILGAPDTLFGGPSIREVFDVYATGH